MRNTTTTNMKDVNVNAVNDTAAVAAVTSPAWLPWLHDVSAVAAELLPIAGVVWLLVQIDVKLFRKGKKDD